MDVSELGPTAQLAYEVAKPWIEGYEKVTGELWRQTNIAWFWSQVSALAPLAWFLGELKGASPEMVSWEAGYQIAWLWAQVAQAALCEFGVWTYGDGPFESDFRTELAIAVGLGTD